MPKKKTIYIKDWIRQVDGSYISKEPILDLKNTVLMLPPEFSSPRRTDYVITDGDHPENNCSFCGIDHHFYERQENMHLAKQN